MPVDILTYNYHRSPSIDPTPSCMQKGYVRSLLYDSPINQALHMGILKNIKSSGKAQFVFLSPYLVNPEQYTAEEWLERVHGGEGCWSLREEVIDTWRGAVVFR